MFANNEPLRRFPDSCNPYVGRCSVESKSDSRTTALGSQTITRLSEILNLSPRNSRQKASPSRIELMSRSLKLQSEMDAAHRSIQDLKAKLNFYRERDQHSYQNWIVRKPVVSDIPRRSVWSPSFSCVPCAERCFKSWKDLPCFAVGESWSSLFLGGASVKPEFVPHDQDVEVFKFALVFYAALVIVHFFIPTLRDVFAILPFPQLLPRRSPFPQDSPLPASPTRPRSPRAAAAPLLHLPRHRPRLDAARLRRCRRRHRLRLALP